MQRVNNSIHRIDKDHRLVFFIGIMLVLMGLIPLGHNVPGNSFHMSCGLLALGMSSIVLAFALIIMETASIETVLEAPGEVAGMVVPDGAQRVAEPELRIARLEKGE